MVSTQISLISSSEAEGNLPSLMVCTDFFGCCMLPVDIHGSLGLLIFH